MAANAELNGPTGFVRAEVAAAAQVPDAATTMHDAGKLPAATAPAEAPPCRPEAACETACSVAEAAEARLMHEAQLADRRKTELLTRLGHELRNPLAAINNALEALERFYPLDGAGQSHRDVIHRQVQHLARLTNDLLEQASTGAAREFVVTEPTVSIPVQLGDPPTVSPPTHQPNGPARILLCEDHVDAGTTLVDILNLLGYQVHWAPDGPQGVAQAKSFQPQIALVDIGLPGFDGYEVARRLRHHFGGRIRLIALTGFGLPEDRVMALSVGFDAHLTKPVDIDELLSLLRLPNGGVTHS